MFFLKKTTALKIHINKEMQQMGIVKFKYEF